MIQRAFCLTYLHCHGLKFQTVMLPNGMWGSVYGASCRHNDLGMLNLSALQDQLIEYFVTNNVTVGDGITMPALFGDQIYQPTLAITSREGDAEEGSFQWWVDKRMNSAREVIEHGYGDMFELFLILHMKKKFKLYRTGPEMHALVVICMFLQNIYTCYNGSKVQGEMDCAGVTIDEYLPLDEILNIIEYPNNI